MGHKLASPVATRSGCSRVEVDVSTKNFEIVLEVLVVLEISLLPSAGQVPMLALRVHRISHVS